MGTESRPSQRPTGRDVGLQLAPGEDPVVRQRVAAYGVVVSDRGLLATQYSDRTAVDGRWGMPGGGIDVGEEPTAAVAREVHEETAQIVELGALVAVQTSHWVGRSPAGHVEDFHAVRLIYRADLPGPERSGGARRGWHHRRRALGGADRVAVDQLDRQLAETLERLLPR